MRAAQLASYAACRGARPAAPPPHPRQAIAPCTAYDATDSKRSCTVGCQEPVVHHGQAHRPEEGRSFASYLVSQLTSPTWLGIPSHPPYCRALHIGEQRVLHPADPGAQCNAQRSSHEGRRYICSSASAQLCPCSSPWSAWEGGMGYEWKDT